MPLNVKSLLRKKHHGVCPVCRGPKPTGAARCAACRVKGLEVEVRTCADCQKPLHNNNNGSLRCWSCRNRRRCSVCSGDREDGDGAVCGPCKATMVNISAAHGASGGRKRHDNEAMVELYRVRAAAGEPLFQD